MAYITPSHKRAKPETSKMADNRKEEFPKCSTLFLSEDGSPMLFYMTPSAMKTKLRPLIRVRDSWMPCYSDKQTRTLFVTVASNNFIFKLIVLKYIVVS